MQCGRLLNDSPSLRKAVLVALQLGIIVTAFFLAFQLRFDTWISEQYSLHMMSLLPALVVIKLATFWRMGLFSGWWRYVSLPDLSRILMANVAASLTVVVYLLLAHDVHFVPRSILILDGILCFLLISGVRVMTRMLRENWSTNWRHWPNNKQRVVVLGAGAVGQSIVREVHQNPHMDKKVIGYIDGDSQRQGEFFQGVPVLGVPKDIKAIFKRHAVDLVIIVQTAVSPRELRAVVEECRRLDITFKILPAVGDILSGDVSVQRMRNVELEDLLGRDPVQLDVCGIREYLQGKRVMVTGAGGSIGSEICRQVAGFGVKELVMFENAETPLFHIESEVQATSPEVAIVPVLGDIRDRKRVGDVFWRYRPEVVFHAAAYKHVPMSESNPIEAVKNNVLGTRNLVDMAHLSQVQRFVMVSTDKAVNPVNTMGASKRVAELYAQGMAKESSTNFVTVRFGNVLGSNGSVVPTFREQIKRGGPVTVTHPEVTRYFMTIPEAVQLVLQAGSMGKGGEIFLLDMGKSVKILKLAEDMIRLSGLTPYEDIDIVFSGLRPGEKLYEELLIDGEGIKPTNHDKIRVLSSSSCDLRLLQEQIEQMFHAIQEMNPDQVIEYLRQIVPEYRSAQPLPKLQEDNGRGLVGQVSAVVRIA